MVCDTNMDPSIVLDTNVLVAAVRSNRGASFRLLSLLGTGKFTTCISVPLLLEYEDALLTHVERSPLEVSDVGVLLDYVCAISRHVEIYFLWRPFVKDPKDDMVLEVAVTGGCDAIITFNDRDFAEVGDRFGIEIATPVEFLKRIGEAPWAR